MKHSLEPKIIFQPVEDIKLAEIRFRLARPINKDFSEN
jgi:hypothetical protein